MQVSSLPPLESDEEIDRLLAEAMAPEELRSLQEFSDEGEDRVGSELQMIKLYLETTKKYNAGMAKQESIAADISKIDIEGKLKLKHDNYLKKKQLEEEAKARAAGGAVEVIEESKMPEISSLALDEVDLILQSSEDLRLMEKLSLKSESSLTEVAPA